MGNCLSKYPMKFEIKSFRERGGLGSSFQIGHDGTGVKARSLGFYGVNRTTILTPVNDRFLAQAFDLEVSKIKGITKPKRLALGFLGDPRSIPT